jgi:hypothetical protein
LARRRSLREVEVGLRGRESFLTANASSAVKQ